MQSVNFCGHLTGTLWLSSISGNCDKFQEIYSYVSWNPHVDQLCNTVAKNIGILYKLHFLPQNILKMLYHSLVSPHLNYCSIVWGFTSSKNINRIHRLQKRGMRIVTNSSYLSHSLPLFLKMQILPIPELISLETAIFMYKLNSNLLPCIFKGEVQ